MKFIEYVDFETVHFKKIFNLCAVCFTTAGIAEISKYYFTSLQKNTSVTDPQLSQLQAIATSEVTLSILGEVADLMLLNYFVLLGLGTARYIQTKKKPINPWQPSV